MKEMWDKADWTVTYWSKCNPAFLSVTLYDELKQSHIDRFDGFQEEGEYNVHISSSGSWQSEMSSTPSDRSSPPPASPPTAETEAANLGVGPSMLEQIQMGFSGQNGFKRFK